MAMVELDEHGILHARGVTFGLEGQSLENFKDDARRVIRVVMGAGTESDLDLLAATDLNAMGVCNLFAAMAFEVDRGYQGEVAKSLREAS